MKKLKKEEVYVNLQGKSKEELTDLYNFLESVGKKIELILDDFLNLTGKWTKLNYEYDIWVISLVVRNKQEVTIQQLKEILQSMDNKDYLLITEDGYKVQKNENVSWVINESYKYDLTLFENHKKLIEEGKGTWKIFKLKENALNYGKETLEQQLEKAKAEVKRIEQEIEDSKIKIGDWVISKLNDCIFKYQHGRLEDDLIKITDQELINKLNNLINAR